MRWTPGGVSGNIEDRRGGGFGGGGMKLGLGGTLVLLVLSLIFGRDFFSLVSPGAYQDTPYSSSADRDAGETTAVQFVSFVLDDAQQTWHRLLPQYRDAKLVLFRDAVQSACGFAQSASGPFYCPADEKVYLDLSFFEELKQRFGAPGDFAQAYVIAHEIGHHVQNLLGLSGRTQRYQRANPGDANAASVRLELQADCLAGVWGNSTAQREILEHGDVEEGLNAAAAIGDDRLTRGRVSPDSFTHGTSAQRATWFRRGLQSGKASDCDTFSASGL
jgi:predicted metalloprotease